MGGPTALILSRQNLPVLANMPAADKRAGTKMGAYTIVKETAELEAIIIGAGSELSMPCMELFERQSAEYIESVLPAAMKSKTTAVEAGVSSVWYKFADKVHGVDSFGESAPAHFIFEAKGITTAGLVAKVKA